MTPAAPLNIPTSSNKTILQKLFWALSTNIPTLHLQEEEDKFFATVDGADINEKGRDGAVVQQLHNILHTRQEDEEKSSSEEEGLGDFYTQIPPHYLRW